ncbi:MAG: hypothetical protein COV10_01300 [Candidatus Vogelbacteria bacterium CG10_big_fil_rev_8_21_14_0_10_51_16]|uniref:Uncharacterized protein n=1 Tax=Candidatus Vogelbacteria bacterium CG10_big_fil_rev_8_21_14_0_10_51_16 TaxID=1975045 RepID=A0A2H0RF22_9BACT|nr:MAG: hypothetical protein COV10_01300 [Candidatus Vogelbacteria bacterium CG10_big_fil_rev_8_21_14_0_10_51_16]
MKLGDFARKHKTLFWSTNAYDQLDERAVVEAVLNYGDWETVKELFSIIGIKRTAEVFREWTRPELSRTNYYPKITHYFRLYFDRYAH